MLLAVRISSYGCTWEVWRALKKLEFSSNSDLRFFRVPRASITRCTHAKHEPILKQRGPVNYVFTSQLNCFETSRSLRAISGQNDKQLTDSKLKEKKVKSSAVKKKTADR